MSHVHMYFGEPPTCPLCERGRLSRIERLALRWLQRRCKHPGDEVVADLLQADNLPTRVAWCSSCGAVVVTDGERTGDLPEMRRPEPTWNVR